MSYHGETGEHILDKVRDLDGLFEVAQRHSIHSKARLDI